MFDCLKTSKIYNQICKDERSIDNNPKILNFIIYIDPVHKQALRDVSSCSGKRVQKTEDYDSKIQIKSEAIIQRGENTNECRHSNLIILR